MKALPMFDNLMLWTTRSCSLICFVIATIALYIQSHYRSASISPIVEGLIIFAVWFACTFALRRPITTIPISALAAVFLLILLQASIQQISEIPFFNGALDYAWHIVLVLFTSFLGFLLIGMASLVWISFRASWMWFHGAKPV